MRRKRQRFLTFYSMRAEDRKCIEAPFGVFIFKIISISEGMDVNENNAFYQER